MCVDSLQQKLAGINENDATSTNFTSNPTEGNPEMAKEIPLQAGSTFRQISMGLRRMYQFYVQRTDRV